MVVIVMETNPLDKYSIKELQDALDYFRNLNKNEDINNGVIIENGRHDTTATDGQLSKVPV